MPLPIDITAIAKNSAIWFIPAFIVWLLLLQPVLLPGLTALASFFAEIAFGHLSPEISLADINDWHIKTRIVAEEASREKPMVLTIVAQSIQMGLFCLPYYWAMSVAICGKELKNTALGTLILMGFVAFLGFIDLASNILSALSVDSFYVYRDDLSQRKYPPYNSTFATVIKQAKGLAIYLIVLILPIAVVYVLNKQKIRLNHLNSANAGHEI